ncbi:MAG: hypothetical protein ACT4P4_08575 [Betaproteobacteria bacterium]
MLKYRAVIVALLAAWLVIGPVGGAWASGGGAACESMMSAVPADDCCGGGAAASACAGVCAAASLGITVVAPGVPRIESSAVPIASLFFRYASRAAPPDVAPPKSLVS